MLLEERCAVVYVGCVALGVALADVLVLLPALLGELGRALGGVLGLALLDVLGLALLDVLSLALLLVLGLTLLLDLLLALGGVLGLALVLVLGLTMIIISRGAVGLRVLFPFYLALVILLVFIFLVLGVKQLLEEPLGLVQLHKDEEDDEAGPRLHCVVNAVDLHNTMN